MYQLTRELNITLSRILCSAAIERISLSYLRRLEMCCSDLYPGNLLISLASKGFVIVKDFEEKLVGWKQRNPTLIYERQEISTHQIFF